MTDRNGSILNPGDRVAYQVHPSRPWRTGTLLGDGRSVRADYDGKIVLPWSGYVARCA